MLPAVCPLQRPCAQNPRASGFEPNYLPNDLSKPRGLNSRCAQLCDEDIGEEASTGIGAAAFLRAELQCLQTLLPQTRLG
jgi:hypothetical protein